MATTLTISQTLLTLDGDTLITALTRSGNPYAGKPLGTVKTGSGKNAETRKAITLTLSEYDPTVFQTLSEKLPLKVTFNPSTSEFAIYANKTGGKESVDPKVYASQVRAELANLSAEFASLKLTDEHLASIKGQFPNPYAIVCAARFYPSLTGSKLCDALKVHSGKKGKTASPRTVPAPK